MLINELLINYHYRQDDNSQIYYFLKILTNVYINKGLTKYYDTLKNIKNTNIFITNEKINILEKYIFKIINTIQNIKKIQIKYIYYKRYISSIKEDLGLNLLTEYDKKNIITIKEHNNNSIWKFYDKDIIKIIKNSLLYQVDGYPEIYYPKNPYTNKTFTKKQLDTIYYYLNNNYHKLPFILDIFQETNYNISKIKKKYRFYLVEQATINYVKSMENQDFFIELKYILQQHLKGQRYIWNKIQNDKNSRNIFEWCVIQFVLYENNSYYIKLEDIMYDLINTIKTNHYDIIFFKEKLSFIKPIQNYNYPQNITIQFNNINNINNINNNQLFIFGNNSHSIVKNVLNNIIDDIINKDKISSYVNNIIDATISKIYIDEYHRLENELKQQVAENNIITSISEIQKTVLSIKKKSIHFFYHQSKISSFYFNHILKKEEKLFNIGISKPKNKRDLMKYRISKRNKKNNKKKQQKKKKYKINQNQFAYSYYPYLNRINYDDDDNNNNNNNNNNNSITITTTTIIIIIIYLDIIQIQVVQVIQIMKDKNIIYTYNI